jgi:hypothetical protein
MFESTSLDIDKHYNFQGTLGVSSFSPYLDVIPARKLFITRIGSPSYLWMKKQLELA